MHFLHFESWIDFAWFFELLMWTKQSTPESVVPLARFACEFWYHLPGLLFFSGLLNSWAESLLCWGFSYESRALDPGVDQQEESEHGKKSRLFFTKKFWHLILIASFATTTQCTFVCTSSKVTFAFWLHCILSSIICYTRCPRPCPMLIMVKRSITKKTKSSYVCLKSFVAKSFRSRKDRNGQGEIVPSSSSSKEQRRGGRGSLVPHCGGRHILRCPADLQLYILAALHNSAAYSLWYSHVGGATHLHCRSTLRTTQFNCTACAHNVWIT